MPDLRFYRDGAADFVIFTVVEWLPISSSEEPCLIVTEGHNFCYDQRGLRTNACAIMPTHFHGIFFHETFDGKLLQNALGDLRKFAGRRLSDFCDGHLPKCMVKALNRQRRFWQAERHPELIHSQRFWKQKLGYLHDNPRRKGLVARPDHWRFSSASYWFGDGREPNDVTLTAIPW